MEDSKEWMSILVPVLVACVGAGGLLPVLIKLFTSWRAQRNKDKGAVTFSLISRAYFILHTLMESTGSSRAVILRAHNGGGPLNPAAHTYSSVLMETRESLPRVLDTWVKQPLDGQYVELLVSILKDGSVELETASMGQDGLLRSLYLKHGVTHSVVVYLWNTDKELFYLSLNFTEKPEGWEFPETNNEDIRVARNSLITLLQDKKIE